MSKYIFIRKKSSYLTLWVARCLNHVTFSAMCGTIGCKQNVASGNVFDNFFIISKPFSKKQRRVPGHCQKTQLW